MSSLRMKKVIVIRRWSPHYERWVYNEFITGKFSTASEQAIEYLLRELSENPSEEKYEIVKNGFSKSMLEVDE